MKKQEVSFRKMEKKEYNIVYSQELVKIAIF